MAGLQGEDDEGEDEEGEAAAGPAAPAAGLPAGGYAARRAKRARAEEWQERRMGGGTSGDALEDDFELGSDEEDSGELSCPADWRLHCLTDCCSVLDPFTCMPVLCCIASHSSSTDALPLHCNVQKAAQMRISARRRVARMGLHAAAGPSPSSSFGGRHARLGTIRCRRPLGKRPPSS